MAREAAWASRPGGFRRLRSHAGRGDLPRRALSRFADAEWRRFGRRVRNATRILGGLPHASSALERPGRRARDPARPGARHRRLRSRSLVGIELLTVDLRIVIASVDTYLRFAEAVNRLDLHATGESWGIGRLGEEGEEMGKSVGKGAVEGGMEEIKDTVDLGGRRQKNG